MTTPNAKKLAREMLNANGGAEPRPQHDMFLYVVMCVSFVHAIPYLIIAIDDLEDFS